MFALARRFPGLTINTLRQRCPACNAEMTDDEIRKGWLPGVKDFTTSHIHCKKTALAVGVAAGSTAGTQVVSTSAVTAHTRSRMINTSTEVQRFVARFTVSSSAAWWKGTREAGPNSLLFCEYMSPTVVVSELARVILSGKFTSTLRANVPAVFWNLVCCARTHALARAHSSNHMCVLSCRSALRPCLQVLWFISYAVPIEHLAFLAREESEEENATIAAAVLADMLVAATKPQTLFATEPQYMITPSGFHIVSTPTASPIPDAAVGLSGVSSPETSSMQSARGVPHGRMLSMAGFAPVNVPPPVEDTAAVPAGGDSRRTSLGGMLQTFATMATDMPPTM